jgi:hypothetical protein
MQEKTCKWKMVFLKTMKRISENNYDFKEIPTGHYFFAMHPKIASRSWSQCLQEEAVFFPKLVENRNILQQRIANSM